MVENFALSPCAFWMSASRPAPSKASLRYLRSAFSHRFEDAVSGRITPTLAVVSDAELPPPPPLDGSSLPHATTPSAPVPAPTTANKPSNIFFVLPVIWMRWRARLAHAEEHVD